MTFYRGQEIECIDHGGFRCLQTGRIYVCTGADNDPGGPWVRVDCCSIHQSRESGYHASRFRPVDRRKTDISVFTAMLDRSKQTERT